MFTKRLTPNVSRYAHTDVGAKWRPFDSIPRPLQIPLLGNWHLYKFGFYNGEKYHEALLDMYERYGPVVYERIGPKQPIIHVFDPADVATVYRNEDRTPRIFPLNEFVKRYRELNGKSAGLGNSNDDEWYRLVNGVRSVMLKSSSVGKFARITHAVTDDLVEEICRLRDRNGQLANLYNLLARWSQEIGGKICLGHRLGYLNGPNRDEGCELVDANVNVFRLGTELKFAFPFHEYFVTRKMAQLIRHENQIHEVWQRHIGQVLSAMREESGGGGADGDEPRFVRSLVDKQQLSVGDVVVVSMTLFTDGLSTTVPVLINNLFALAVNERVQNKLYDEICAAEAAEAAQAAQAAQAADSQNRVDLNFATKLPYLKAVLKETFRMYPNGTEVARINKKPLVLSDYYIPPETRLSMNVLVHFRSEQYFPKADEYIPERWLKGCENSEPNPFLATPFGFGARTCAGRKFAEQDLQISLCQILKNFRLTYPADGPPIDFTFHTLLFPQNDLPIRFIRR